MRWVDESDGMEDLLVVSRLCLSVDGVAVVGVKRAWEMSDSQWLHESYLVC